MDNKPQIYIDDSKIISILLHDLKNVLIELSTAKDSISKLQDQILDVDCENKRIVDMIHDMYDIHQNRIKVPHRCPICNGTMWDAKEEMCVPCDGTGLVWG